MAKNIFAKAYQGSARLHVTAYVAALEVLREAAVRRLPVELTAWFTQLPEEGKFRRDVGEALLRGGLLYLPDLDLYLAKVGGCCVPCAPGARGRGGRAGRSRTLPAAGSRNGS